MNKSILLILLSISTSTISSFGQNNFSNSPDSVTFYTVDIINFWRVFDKTEPKFDADLFENEYIAIGSKGLKGFIPYRIKSGENISKAIKSNLNYYKSVRESSFSIDKQKEKLYPYFRKLKEIYSSAVFPDVYFVIGAKNSGGTVFNEGLIIGAEMFGEPTVGFNPIFNIDYVDEVVVHELIHFQQNYPESNTLLDQCIREGSADFLCELITGDHSHKEIHEYGEANIKMLWAEFLKEKSSANWSNWLYKENEKPRPADLGYWIGYKITKAFYNNMVDKEKSIVEILNISDFNTFFEKSGYNGQ